MEIKNGIKLYILDSYIEKSENYVIIYVEVSQKEKG
jgi:hypothetical protein